MRRFVNQGRTEPCSSDKDPRKTTASKDTVESSGAFIGGATLLGQGDAIQPALPRREHDTRSVATRPRSIDRGGPADGIHPSSRRGRKLRARITTLVEHLTFSWKRNDRQAERRLLSLGKQLGADYVVKLKRRLEEHQRSVRLPKAPPDVLASIREWRRTQ